MATLMAIKIKMSKSLSSDCLPFAKRRTTTIEVVRRESFMVGLLLLLVGQASEVGKGMLNKKGLVPEISKQLSPRMDRINLSP